MAKKVSAPPLTETDCVAQRIGKVQQPCVGGW
jgi:hypothetical protein